MWVEAGGEWRSSLSTKRRRSTSSPKSWARMRPARESLLALVRALGRLPLALHLAAGYLRMGDSPEMFLERLRGKGLALGPIDPSDPTFHERSREVLAKTFELSLDALGREGGERASIGERLRRARVRPAAASARASAPRSPTCLSTSSKFELGGRQLSLLERVARSGGGNAFRLHPLLAGSAALARKDPVIDRMTEWFVERLPEGGEDQGRRWGEVHDETAALIEWLPQVPGHGGGSSKLRYNTQQRTALSRLDAFLRGSSWPRSEDEDARSRTCLWILGQVALRGGLPSGRRRRRGDAQLSLRVGAENWAAVSAGSKADILQARGDLDGALKSGGRRSCRSTSGWAGVTSGRSAEQSWR